LNKILTIFIGVFFLCVSLSYAEEPLSSPQILDKEMDYIVKEGDNLWDISQRFYGDPFLWPRLWYQNQYVTNPHYIYPGDRIRLYPYKVLIEIEEETKPPTTVGVKPLPQPPVEEVPPPLPPIPEIVRLVVYPEVRSSGFITPEIEGIGRIVSAKVDKLELVAEDEIYINFQKGFPPKKGDQFTVFRVGETIKHPIIKKTELGRKVKILGTVVITKTKEEEAQTALITRSYDSMLRGDQLTPYFAPREELVVSTVEKPVYGWIVASKQSKLELVEGDVVYIDRGEVDSIRPGHIFHVLRRGAVVKDPIATKKKEKVKLPDELIARLVVIRTQQKTSSAVIVQTRLPVQIGDEITTVSE
jgi:hypothetical protein